MAAIHHYLVMEYREPTNSENALNQSMTEMIEYSAYGKIASIVVGITSYFFFVICPKILFFVTLGLSIFSLYEWNQISQNCIEAKMTPGLISQLAQSPGIDRLAWMTKGSLLCGPILRLYDKRIWG